MSFGSRSNAILYAYPTMNELANEIDLQCREVKDSSDETVRNRRAASGCASCGSNQRIVEYRPDSISFDKFPDGFPNLFIKDVHDMSGKDVFFLASFDSPAVIFEQLSLIYAIPRYIARSLTLILPYFPTGTMERVDHEGQVATAVSLARLISQIPTTLCGPAQVMIFDIHALQERFYFGSEVLPRLTSAVPLILSKIKEFPDSTKKIRIAFPDGGAFKRFHRAFHGYETIVCNKVRDGRKRSIRIKEGSPRDKHVVIVDDLVQSGGTLIECAKVLLNEGASKVSCYVTHAVFPNESWKRFLPNEIKQEYTQKADLVDFHKFWITDSLPHAREICKNDPFELLSLSKLIAETLQDFDLLM